MRARKATKAATPRHEAGGAVETGGDPQGVDPIPPADLDELPRGGDPLVEGLALHAGDDDGEMLDPRRVCVLCGDDVSIDDTPSGDGVCEHRECARLLRSDGALRAALARVSEAQSALRSAQRGLYGALRSASNRGDAEIEPAREAPAASEPVVAVTAPVQPEGCVVCAARDAQIEALAVRKSERRRRPEALPAAQTAFRFAEPVAASKKPSENAA